MKNLFLSAFALTAILTLGSCSKDDDNGGGGGGSATISSLSCATAIVNGTPTPGTAFNGSATISYSGGNGASYAAATTTSTGVTGLTATLIAGTLGNGAGVLTFLVTGTPSASGTAAFAISFGGQSCTLNVNVPAPPPIASKWYYAGRIDSAYCCLPGARSGTPLAPYAAADSNIVRTFTANTYYYDFKADKTFTEFYLDQANYSGTYTFGSSSYTLSDTLNAVYGASDIQYWRVNSMTASALVMRDRGWYTQTSSGRGLLPNGDTLVYRLVWNFNK